MRKLHSMDQLSRCSASSLHRSLDYSVEDNLLSLPEWSVGSGFRESLDRALRDANVRSGVADETCRPCEAGAVDHCPVPLLRSIFLL